MKIEKLAIALAVLGASAAAAADRQPLSYTFVEGEYAIMTEDGTIVTEKGVVEKPDTRGIAALFE